jgi:plasmid stabilization system protein ParE
LTQYSVEYTSRAEEQLDALHIYISQQSSEQIAARFVEGVIDYCDSLSTFPLRGIQRDDIRPGLRITNYRKRVAIAFEVDGAVVNIVAIFYGGQNYEAVLGENEVL